MALRKVGPLAKKTVDLKAARKAEKKGDQTVDARE